MSRVHEKAYSDISGSDEAVARLLSDGRAAYTFYETLSKHGALADQTGELLRTAYGNDPVKHILAATVFLARIAAYEQAAKPAGDTTPPSNDVLLNLMAAHYKPWFDYYSALKNQKDKDNES